jgi:hypothetical protein
VGIELVVVMLILMIAVVFLFSRFNLGARVRCTRCDGTGHVNERWPDPTQPGGWHVVEGRCPKCKGKGKV